MQSPSVHHSTCYMDCIHASQRMLRKRWGREQLRTQQEQQLQTQQEQQLRTQQEQQLRTQQEQQLQTQQSRMRNQD
ncbi:hypothetical protein BDBG_16438 [Blastomyces gilchristii SLH14081]|uniref:Uncharacterized protein n=1 Tax=Blastomyces gilchristii (strain SLH14081) TaxID=559298 RepID=A0A179UB19_BLAGS|nr:uncharacterized protein BDBG_16438 [Blastomyces gilchristii SLH14081]OAT05225.1 hypothetical protein BDBG_16438 [Blastomyces gilchristii SLH14081]